MAHLDITRLESQAISNTLVDNKNTYLLLDALAIERWAYVPLSPDSLEIPEVKELADILKEHDRYIKLQWLWEDTEWHSHYRQGPCLAQLEPGSALIDYFVETLAEHGFGIMIQSAYSNSSLFKHLQSLLRVVIEGKGPTYFTFHSPNSIASYFDALAAKKMQQLLGPIEHLVWRQNTGKAHQWFGYFSDKNDDTQLPESNNAKELGWFHFSQDEMRSINQDALLHFRKSLINDALYYRQQGYFERQPTMQLQQLDEATIRERVHHHIEQASQADITDKALIKRWVELHLYYPNDIEQEYNQKLLYDTSVHPNKRIKQINYRIEQAPSMSSQGAKQ